MNHAKRLKDVLARKPWSVQDEQELRELVIRGGIPDDSFLSPLDPEPAKCSLRGLIWKLLLRVPKLDAKRYEQLNAAGKNVDYGQKIYNDTHRTLAKDMDFESVVTQQQIFRVLNAFVNAHANNPDHGPTSKQQHTFSYVQGMNALCAPFLYVMPELDAFHSFEVLMTRVMPAYVSKNLRGVQDGCKLLEQVLQSIDPELHSHLMQSGVRARVYAFAPLLTMSACCPPFRNALPIWDLFIACGFHLNVITQCCQLVLARDELLSSKLKGVDAVPWLNGRDFRSLSAESLKHLVLTTCLRLDPNITHSLRKHLVSFPQEHQEKFWATA